MAPSLKRLTLRHNFLWNLAGNIVYAGCQASILIVLARLSNPETVGIYSLGMTVALPVFTPLSLQLRVIQSTDAKEHYEFGDYLAVRILTTLAALVLVCAFCLVANYPLHTVRVIVLVGITRCVDAISDIYYGELQRQERMDRIAKSMIVKGILSLIGLSSVLYLTMSIDAALLALIAVWSLVFVFYDVRVSTRYLPRRRPVWNTSKIRSLIFHSSPMAAVSLLGNLQVNIPRLLLEHYGGVRELGIFAALASLQSAGFLAVNAVSQAAIPRLAKSFVKSDFRDFWRVGRILLLGTAGFGVVLVIGVQLAGNSAVGLLFGHAYADRQSLLMWIAVGALAQYIAAVLQYMCSAVGQFRIQAAIYAVSDVVVIAGSLFLIPRFGTLGAAQAVAGASVACAIASAYPLITAARRRTQ
jgi:O-antigen/teichoic acid export membrane protein